MKPLVLPQISINGTTREMLVEQQSDVVAALRTAYDVMATAAPHMRDYQYRADEWKVAVEAWQERMIIVYRLMKDIEVHGMAIQDYDPVSS